MNVRRLPSILGAAAKSRRLTKRGRTGSRWWRRVCPSRLTCGFLLVLALLGACAEAPIVDDSEEGAVSEAPAPEQRTNAEAGEANQGFDEHGGGAAAESGSGDEQGSARRGGATDPGANAGAATRSSDRDDEPSPDGGEVQGDAAVPAPPRGVEASASTAYTGGDGAVANGDAATVDAGMVVATDSNSALCSLEGSQVGLLGDSYIALSDNVPRFIEEHARAASALSASDSYINRARSGASMAYEPSIPSQLPELLQVARARRSAGVKLIIMDGGGNDVLVHNRRCLSQTFPSQACIEVVDRSILALKKLFIDMAAAGIEHVIYFWYPDVPASELAGQRPEVMNGYAASRVEETCTASTEVTCHFVDTRPAFAGHPEYLSPLDSVHPTAAGARAIAGLVWGVMVDACLAAR